MKHIGYLWGLLENVPLFEKSKKQVFWSTLRPPYPIIKAYQLPPYIVGLLLYAFVLNHYKSMSLFWSRPLGQSLHEMKSCPVFFEQSVTPSELLYHPNIGVWVCDGLLQR